MAGALAALVAAVDLALRLLFVLFLLFTLGCHDALAPALDGAPIIFLSTWRSIPQIEGEALAAINFSAGSTKGIA